ncbi:DNA-binding transcriptional regulator, PucR family [Arthrobacter crystallopoietes]|uniref:DNA-binding transcriptional regulator, PucR family n=1 Tax=Crystallibacter crystallopoietes TaxID=37928 RepID=A0A1H0ZN99_9MICC|nr:DNA-binding transcriptional regulator, PucR family [Arthrobacter crystallopoietes]
MTSAPGTNLRPLSCGPAQTAGNVHEVVTLAKTPDSIGLPDLLQVLERSGLLVRSYGNAPKLSLTSPALYDPLAPVEGFRGEILLGIGLHPANPETNDVVLSAAGAGFGAIVLKQLSQDIDGLVTTAVEAGIALLVVDDAVGWRQLYALLESALSTAAETSRSPSPLGAGDLFALANAIAAMVGGATTIENLQEQVLAYSALPDQPIDEDRRNGILGRQVPYLPENAEQYASVFQSRGAVHIKGIGTALDRLAIAVRAGNQPLGSIWVVDADGNLDSDAEQALERAADIAALHMLRARSANDLARQQRAELLRRLLEGGDDVQLIAEQLGLKPSGPFVVVAFQPDLSQADEISLLRLVDLVTTQCESHRQGAHCVLIGTTIYALFADAAASALGSIEALARRLIERSAATLPVQLRVSTGSAAATVAGISRSRHDADLVLLMLASGRSDGAYASAQEVRSRLTLLELAAQFRNTPRLMSPAATRMVEFDAKSGTDYAKTLRTYLDLSRDSAKTAAALSLHQNTLRYRLRRLSELFGIDLGQPEDTLVLWLSLHLQELL